MKKHHKIYRLLQKHLDNMPVGFPASISNDADIKLLQHIFTPEEAQIACCLTYKPETIDPIFDRVKKAPLNFVRSQDHLVKILENIQKKGGIESKIKDGLQYYCNAPLVVGMYEMQVNRLTPEFLEDFGSYSKDINFSLDFLSLKKPQLRTIPIKKSITPKHNVSHFDDILQLFENAQPPFVVLECICRKKSRIEGQECRVTHRTETCLAIGAIGTTCILMQAGREITRDEAIEIIEKNQKDGLVLQPSNTEKLEFLCSCCGCCCGMLEIHQKLPIPSEFWSSNFYAVIDNKKCNGCGLCKKRCQVGAVEMASGSPSITIDNCIGCGICAASCPKEAVTLIKKERVVVPPYDREALNEILMSDKPDLNLLSGKIKNTFGKLKTAGKLAKGIMKTGNIDLFKE